MGSGKTTTGLKLSYKLHMPVEDTDRLIRSEMIGETIRTGSAEMRFDAYEGAMSLADGEISSLLSNGMETDIESFTRDLQTKITEYLKRF